MTVSSHVMLVATLIATGCTPASRRNPTAPPAPPENIRVRTGTPPCRFVSVDEQRLVAVVERALTRLAGCRKVETGFARRIHLNPASSEPIPPDHLVIEVVQDASNDDVDASGCVMTGSRSTDGGRDRISVRGICEGKPGDGREPSRVRCSASAMEEVLRWSRSETWDLPLLYIVTHELSHIARRHTAGALLPAPATVNLANKPKQRAEDVVSFCRGLSGESHARRQELDADEDALHVVRIELDDVSVAGPGCLVPPERGGTGELRAVDVVGDRPHFIREPGRGRRVATHFIAGQFRGLADALAALQLRGGRSVVVPAVLADPPVEMPDRARMARTSNALLCEALSLPATRALYLLPTLPGVTHPDGHARLFKITGAIDRIGNDRAQLDAVIDRQTAAFTTGLVAPMCKRAPDVQLRLADNRAASCADLTIEPDEKEVCRPFASAVQELSPPRSTINTSVTAGAGPNIYELSLPVSAVASLGSRGVVVGTGAFGGAHTAVGLVSGAGAATLTELPCTPASFAVGERSAILFCQDPLAVVELDEAAHPLHVQRLRKVMLDGEMVDGYIPGLLDRDGNPEDQSMYDPSTPGHQDRYGVPLLRQVRLPWAGVVDGRTLAALEFPAGGPPEQPERPPMGVTVEYRDGRLSALPLWSRLPWCTSMTSAMAISSSGGQWVGFEMASPLVVTQLTADGSGVTGTGTPRRLPGSSELSDDDVPRCTLVQPTGTVVCVDERGGVFSWDPGTGGRKAWARLPKQPGETTVDWCSTRGGLHWLTRKEDPLGTRFVLRALPHGKRQAVLLHDDVHDRAGLACGPLGAAAFFSWLESALVLNVPAGG